MPNQERKYRFLLIQPFHLSEDSPYKSAPIRGNDVDMPKEERLPGYDRLKHLLEDVDWEIHVGPLAPYGNWPVENREEFCMVAAGRLPIVREACESGKYNAIILLGGGEPGFFESREIARTYHIPVTASVFSQVHIASMLGNKFSIIDLADAHNMWLYNLVVQHHFAQRCASIRNINYPLPRPGCMDERSLREEQKKAVRGERSEAVDAAVKEAVAAIEEDGAEVITLGCGGTFWLQPFIQKGLDEIGWEVPVLEGYSCAITLAKAMVDLGVDASGLLFPSDRPKKWRRKKVF